MSGHIHLKIFSLCAALAVTGALFFTAVPTLAATDVTPGCGALDEKICKGKKAIFISKAANKKPKGAFLDPRNGGEYWSCPDKYKRSVFPVNGKKACAKGLTKFKKAEFIGKAFVKKPKGAFLDLRKGGEYWSCPRGYFRGVTKVNSGSACMPDLDKVCDKGNVDIRGTCKKKGVCGKQGDRPCLIVERVPSCNKGLMEDFISNTCLKPEALICMTMNKLVKGALKGQKTLGKAEKKAEKTIADATTTAFKTVLGKKGYKNFTGSLKSLEKEKKKAEKKITKVLTPITKEIDKRIDSNFVSFASAMNSNRKKVFKVLASNDFCSSKAVDKVASIIGAVGYNPLGGSNTYFTIGIAGSYTWSPQILKQMNIDLGAGPEIAVYIVTDLKSKAGLRLGLGAGAGTGDDGGADVGLITGVAFADSMSDVNGLGLSVGIGAESLSGDKKGISGELSALLSTDFKLEGIEVAIGLGDKNNDTVPISGSVGVGYDLALGGVR